MDNIDYKVDEYIQSLKNTDLSPIIEDFIISEPSLNEKIVLTSFILKVVNKDAEQDVGVINNALLTELNSITEQPSFNLMFETNLREGEPKLLEFSIPENDKFFLLSGNESYHLCKLQHTEIRSACKNLYAFSENKGLITVIHYMQGKLVSLMQFTINKITGEIGIIQSKGK